MAKTTGNRVDWSYSYGGKTTSGSYDKTTGKSLSSGSGKNKGSNSSSSKVTNNKNNTSNASNKSPVGSNGLSTADQAAINSAQKAYQEAKLSGNTAAMNEAHKTAESIRSKYGYSGGTDGSQKISINNGSSSGGGGGVYSSGNKSNSSSNGNNSALNYNRGNGYGNRATTFEWYTPSGIKTTTSNATNYRDAAREAGIDLSNSKMLNASSYFYSNGSKGNSDTTTGDDRIWSQDGGTASYDQVSQIFNQAFPNSARQYNPQVASDNERIRRIIGNMQANSQAWSSAPAGDASTTGSKAWLSAQNESLAKQSGLPVEKGADGNWYYTGTKNKLYDVPSTQALNTNNNTAQTQLLSQLYGLPQYNANMPQLQDNTDLINRMSDLALEQALEESKYATKKGIRDLEYAYKSALPQYQTMRDQSEINAAKALDTQVLQAALKGDNGGLAQRQYGAIQSAASQRLQEINIEQVALENSTNQAIADLKAQGRFQEANIIAANAQNKMAALMEERNRLYAAQMDQYRFNENMALQQAGLTGYYKGQQTLSGQEHAQAQKDRALNNALAMVENGFITDDVVSALGVPKDQVQGLVDYINAMRQIDLNQAKLALTKAQSAGSGRKSSSSSGLFDDLELDSQTSETKTPNITGLASLMSRGTPQEQSILSSLYGKSTKQTNTNSSTSNVKAALSNATNAHSDSWFVVDGTRYTYQEIADMIARNEIEGIQNSNGTITVKKVK